MSVSDYMQNRTLNILFIGNLHQSKGLFDLLHSIPDVTAINPKVHYWIAGEWTSDIERRQAMQILSEHDIEKYVTFLGLVTGEEKIEFFMQGDVLVHPTHYDGQPLVILEAMSVGLPIISTNVGSIMETIEDGKNGYIVPTNKPNKIAEAILKFSSNESLLNEMGQKSKTIFNYRFKDAVFVKRVSKIFQDILTLK